MTNRTPKQQMFKCTWEQRKLRDIADVTKLAGFEFTEHIIYSDEGNVIALRGLNVKNGSLVLDDVQYIDNSNFSKLSRSKLYVNDVLFTYVGTVGELAIIPENDRFYLAPNVARIRFNRDYFSPFMIQQMGSKSFFDNMIFPLIATSSQPALSMENIRKFMVAVPENTSEQEAIGRFLRNLDSLITLHQREQDVSAGSTILINGKNNTSTWEQRKLGELVHFSKGTGYSKADLKEFGIPLILYGRLYTKYQTVITEVDTFADAKPVSVYSQGGEVIVPASGETAEDISIASVVEKSGVLLGGDLNIITPPDGIDSAFLAISISNGKPHDDMAKMAQGKSVVHLHNADLEKINLLYPDHTEQIKISGYFKQLDNLITLHQRKQ